MIKQKKIDALRRYMRSNKWDDALSLAAKFPRLGEHRAAIVRAHEVVAHPGFYAQIGFDERSLYHEGINALRSRYSFRPL